MLNDFAYVAIDQAGKEGRGVIAAANRNDALARLKERSLTVIELKEKKTGGQITFARRRRINNQDTYYMAEGTCHPPAFRDADRQGRGNPDAIGG